MPVGKIMLDNGGGITYNIIIDGFPTMNSRKYILRYRLRLGHYTWAVAISVGVGVPQPAIEEKFLHRNSLLDLSSFFRYNIYVR